MLMTTPNLPSQATATIRETVTADLCIIGAGPGGLALAASAAAFGQLVVIVEKHRMGGASLNYGSLPAAALFASARRAHAFRSAAQFGIAPVEPQIDRAAVQKEVAAIQAASAPNATEERMTALGVRVIRGAARFSDAKTIAVGDVVVSARRYVVATGASPVVPDIRGLADTAYLTTETIHDARGAVEHLVIIGGGATGIEYAQAYRRLGARVTVVDKGRMLGRIDTELAAVITAQLTAEGVTLIEDATVQKAEGGAGRVQIDVQAGGKRSRIEGTHLLVACGRRPAIDEIGLEVAKIAVTADGIKVNGALRTTNRRVYAMGDVTGLPHSTQRAEYHAGLLLGTLLFRSPRKADPKLVPDAVYTDPEFATVGLTEDEARRTHSTIQVFRWPLRENPRALADRATHGHIKVLADRGGKVLGAALVAPAASELIAPWSLALSKGLTLADMGGWIAPFPTVGDVSRRATLQSFARATANAISRRWVKVLSRFG